MLVMGALNWTAEWWDASRTPLDGIVSAAQKLVRSALLPVSHYADRATKGA